jgi:hypothetical protein
MQTVVEFIACIPMIAITENYEKSFNSDGSKIHQYQQNENLSL